MNNNKEKDMSHFCPFHINRTDYCDASACGLWSEKAQKCGIAVIANDITNILDKK